MANNAAGNPFIVDTATAISIVGSGTAFNLFAIRWVSGSTGDAISVQDSAGNVKWASVGGAANNVEGQIFGDDSPIVCNV